MEQLYLIIFIGISFVVWVLVFIFNIRSVKEVKTLIYSFTPAGKAKLDKEYVDLLSAHSVFFNNLSAAGQKIFVLKCSNFIDNKRFIGMAGLEITGEIKIRIASTAAQVTFGLSNSAFSHYHTVKVFPESFYSRMHNNYLKGGASSGGSLFFSWHDFESGFADLFDRYNLGLHEMAHALRLQLKHGRDFDLRFASYTDHWVEMALPEFERMNQGKTSFLRNYGGTNIEEFFAVCIEHFFEVPEEFKKQLPDIFNHLCFLLNLDPTRKEDDYKLIPGFVASVNRDAARMPLPLKLQRAYQYDNWHWSFNIIVAGLFGGIPAIFIFHGKVLFNGLHVFLIFLTVTALIMFLRSFFIQKGILLFNHLLLLCIAGAGPLSTSAVMASNYFIKSNYVSKAHKVIHVYRFVQREGNVNRLYYSLTLENNAYQSYPEIRMIYSGAISQMDLLNTVYLSVTTTTGLWGFCNFEERSVLMFTKD